MNNQSFLEPVIYDSEYKCFRRGTRTIAVLVVHPKMEYIVLVEVQENYNPKRQPRAWQIVDIQDFQEVIKAAQAIAEEHL